MSRISSDCKPAYYVASFSGGKDSTAMVLHLIERGDPLDEVIFCDTTMEHPAMLRHVDKVRAVVEAAGVKFTTLRSERDFEYYLTEYNAPKRGRSSAFFGIPGYGWPRRDNGKESALNIAYAPYLKEYMVANPPPPISAKCCEKAKKDPAERYAANHDYDLVCTGLRKSEGGTRAIAHTTCFSSTASGANSFRPVFWLTDADKKEYKDHYGLTYSDCYEVWGMTRTGCPGCPYGKDFERELELMKQYEPKFYRAAVKIFGASYEYTRGYLRYRAARKAEEAKA